MSAILAIHWLRMSAAAVHEQRERLTALDAAIGDGDHGINLDRGFARVIGALDACELPDDDAGRLLTAAGRLVLGTVGGASGALYGRALIRTGERLTADRRATDDARADERPQALTESHAATARAAGRHSDLAALAAALGDGVDSIAALGRSRPGEKTMLDALVPAVAALQKALEADESLPRGLREAARAADAGARSTIPMLATKGRASYLGPRSIGHLDPGAASSALLLATLADAAAALEAESSAAD